jgi:hypothetical protein
VARVGPPFDHRVGLGLLKLNDHTAVIEPDPPDRLVLRARTRPLAAAEIMLLLTTHGRGTEVTMTEAVEDPLSRLAFDPVAGPLVDLRNVKSLRRLRRLADRQTSP